MQVQVIDYQDKQAANKFAAGLKEIGFAVIANHPLNQALIDDAYQQWAAFFTHDDKFNYEFVRETHEGYISQALSETAKGCEVKDLKEFFHYYPWGKCPAELKTLTQNLFDALTGLAKELLGWIEKEMPEQARDALSMPLSDMITDSQVTLFRLIHYPPLKGNEPEGAVRAAAHEDINLITLLPAATAEGLQVQNSSGEWLDVPCDPNWIIVNTGDMLQECTGNFYKATSHRVINPTGDAAKQSRLAMPLFLHPREDVRLSERHTAESYRQERFAELGLAA